MGRRDVIGRRALDQVAGGAPVEEGAGVGEEVARVRWSPLRGYIDNGDEVGLPHFDEGTRTECGEEVGAEKVFDLLGVAERVRLLRCENQREAACSSCTA